MMAPQMMPNSMMQQQMMQQQMMAQADQQAPMLNLLNEVNDSLNFTFIFHNTNGTKYSIIMQNDKRVKDLLNRYINEVYGITNKKINFLYNASKLDQNNDRRKIKEVFYAGYFFIITVDELN